MLKKKTIPAMLAVPMFFLSLQFAGSCGAAGIVADPSFSGDGLTTTKIGAGRDEAKAIGVQDDGKIVVAGQSGEPDSSVMAVIRYLPDGSIDHDFQFTAATLIGAGFGADGVRALQFDAAGNIVLGGFATENGTRHGALLRLQDDGSLDYQFGDQGVVLFDGDGSGADFFDLSIDPDERITAAGSAGSGSEAKPLLVRFNADGTVDDSYADGGVRLVAELKGAIHGIDAYGDGRITGGGYAVDNQDQRWLLLVRVNGDGGLDEEFGDHGWLSVADLNTEVIVHDIGLLPDERIVAVGETVDDEDRSSVMISRFMADGSPDADLSPNGILSYDIGEESGAYGVSVLDSGVILVAGYRRDEAGKDTIVLRLDSAGSAITEIHLPESATGDSDLGDDISEVLKISGLQVAEGSYAALAGQDAELITTELAGSDEQSLAVEALADGTIYTAGSSGTEDDTALMVAKYTSDYESAVSAGKPAPQTSDFYRITTLPVTDITRVGALTGGQITALGFDSDACLQDCESSCSGDDSSQSETSETTTSETDSAATATAADLTCVQECSQGCVVPTVEKRGVVFSKNPKPEYEADTSTDTSGDGSTDTGSDSSTDTGNTTGTTNPLGTASLLNLDDYIVEGGQTDDGDGDGEYTSDIADVNPQTIYYVRAYALLSDGTVIYGNETQFRTLDSCFIATAAFGSIDGYGVQVLRQFRDTFLKPTHIGSAAVGWYYRISPPIADLVAGSVALRVLVIALLLPVVVWAWMMLHLQLVFTGVAGAALIRTYLKRRVETEIA